MIYLHLFSAALPKGGSWGQCEHILTSLGFSRFGDAPLHKPTNGTGVLFSPAQCAARDSCSTTTCRPSSGTYTKSYLKSRDFCGIGLLRPLVGHGHGRRKNKAFWHNILCMGPPTWFYSLRPSTQQVANVF